MAVLLYLSLGFFGFLILSYLGGLYAKRTVKGIKDQAEIASLVARIERLETQSHTMRTDLYTLQMSHGVLRGSVVRIQAHIEPEQAVELPPVGITVDQIRTSLTTYERLLSDD